MKPGLLAEVWKDYQTSPDQHATGLHIEVERTSLAGLICIRDKDRIYGFDAHMPAGNTIDYAGETWYVPDLAVALTGITPCEGRWLFHLHRTMDELKVGVEAILADLAIPGRPYHVFPDADYRYMLPNGSIDIVAHRRSVLVRIGSRWETIEFASCKVAAESAALVARDRGCTILTRPNVTYVRSMPA